MWASAALWPLDASRGGVVWASRQPVIQRVTGAADQLGRELWSPKLPSDPGALETLATLYHRQATYASCLACCVCVLYHILLSHSATIC